MQLPDELVRKQVERGAIFLSGIFLNIDHPKFFVVVGVSADAVAGFFFVNSNINRYIQGKPALLAMQMPMKHAVYNFLKYDSFLSATSIERVPVHVLTDTIKNGSTKLVGHLQPDDLNLLLEAARSSRLFSKFEKQKFLY